MADKYSLDASALLALLNAEKGAELVLDRLPHSVISAINLAEVITRFSIAGMPEADIRKTLSLLGLEIIPFDEEQAFRAGLLSQYTQPLGLSLGDRACLALALTTHSTALTADRVWKQLDLGLEIELIR